jgi:CHAT domain-containing protein
MDVSTPIPELRRKIEALGETDPFAALDLLCGSFARVRAERGEQSLDLARWTQALATPLIAYLNRYAEAESLLLHARPILERRLGHVSAEVADIHVAYAWMALRRGQLRESAESWARALTIRERVPGKKQIELQRALVGLAQAQMTLRQYAVARRLADRAFGILRANKEAMSEAAAAIQNLLANIAFSEEQFLDAQRHSEQQVAIELELKARGGPDQPVTAYALLGRILERLNEFPAAESALRESVRYAQLTNGPLQRPALTALVLLASLLNDRGDPRQAAEFSQQALTLAERELGPNAPNVVPILHNLMLAHRSLGDLAQAMRDIQRAALIIDSSGANIPSGTRARHHRLFGALLLEIGDHDAARVELGHAEQLTRDDPNLSIERATALLLRASLAGSGEIAAARRELQEAARLYRSKLPGDHPLVLRALNQICQADLTNNQTASESCSDVAAALKVTAYADPGLRQAVLQNLSELAMRQSDLLGMRQYAVDSMIAAQSLATPDPGWRADFQLARVLRVQQQDALAIFFGKRAIDDLQLLRQSLTSEGARLEALFVRDKVQVYRTLADWLMEAGRLDEALEVLGLLKTQELSEFLQRAAPVVAGDNRVSRNDAELALERKYRDAIQTGISDGHSIQELARRRQNDRITADERARLEKLLVDERALEQQRVDQLEGFLRDSSAGVAAARGGARVVQAARLDREIRRLGSDTALAIYLLTDHKLRILIATRREQLERDIDLNANDLRRDIGNLLANVAQRRDIEADSRHLFETLLRPVVDAARAAGAKRLVLWPDDALRYLPFSLLRDGDRFLVDDFALQLFAADTATQPLVEANNALTIRGLGVTKALAGFAALPAVADELCGIVAGPILGLEVTPANCKQPADAGGPATGRGQLRGAAFANASFDAVRVDKLLTEPRDFSVLHWGTHFYLRPGNAIRSFLLLGDGGQLTVDHLAHLNFFGVELMTLSACQTALGGAVTEDGREVEALSALMQVRGARRVIASLWRVDDFSTSLLMREFYRRLGGRAANSARALQGAQLYLRQMEIKGQHPYQHPYFWSGFTLASAAP